MKRNILKIDKEKCNGCGLCINACHEGALQLIHGKACLVSESYCDGLGNCLPQCPTGAISIEEREAEDFDAAAVQSNMNLIQSQSMPQFPCGCPGTQAKIIVKKQVAEMNLSATDSQSQLNQWPCQIKLVPVNAPYLENANLLVAADCTAFAYANIHQRFMKNKITLIGCPKLDEGDYAEKLTAILEQNEIKSITVLRMEVPCCGGIVHAVKQALINSGKMLPCQMITLSTDGNIIKE
ncbi:MAG TPA: ferredoxin [Firmicutes bacterium]|jgi:ferredoxin|nr:ferredoxin [Bacillota bacterium]